MVRMIGKKVRLSGAEQITLWLKYVYGGWRKYIKTAQHESDKQIARNLQAFEKKYKIRFIAKDVDEITFKCLTKEAGGSTT